MKKNGPRTIAAADYDALAIEKKWQAVWRDRETNKVDLKNGPNPFYNLMMFPYPSADGLHIGNIYAFSGADIQGRFQRLRGHTVFEPIGFDAFGINAENFAIKSGTHPAELIPRNIANFSRQLSAMGMMYDWSRVVDTTQPAYYRWTQWIFVQLFKAGLVERRTGPVNWCPVDKTVLSNEQVVDGHCERCGARVETRNLAQWFLRITDYADRLLANLDEDQLDWAASTKMIQKNWIGRSDGAKITFTVKDHDVELRVFTTRAETAFGASFIALASEHPAIDQIIAAERIAEVAALRDRLRRKDVVSRRIAGVGKDPEGAPLGCTATNPLTGEELPVFVTDYVLHETGTGAVMGVPAHDDRDFRFAKMRSLPIRPVIQTPGNTDAEEAYTAVHPDDRIINSDTFDGLSPVEARVKIIAHLTTLGQGVASTTYKLKDWCISRQRYWGPPIPIIYCDTCGPQAVPEDDLPVELPDLPDFEAKNDGISPLSGAQEFVAATCPTCGQPAQREVDVSDTFLDSAWYFLRYPSTTDDTAPFDPDMTRKWLPVDLYIGGQEHAVLHLMYARFVTMALSDLGKLPFEEPFLRFRPHGMIVKDGQKMSKSKGNVVGPDDYLGRFGADALRCYLMFMGPFTEGGDFQESGIIGITRFLRRLWGQVGAAQPATISGDDLAKLHNTIRQVTQDVVALRYNTAIAALMELSSAIRARKRAATREEATALVIMLAPFAPHFAEEAWTVLGEQSSIFEHACWPSYDAAFCVNETVNVVVQVDGKRRGSVQVARGAAEDMVRTAIRADQKLVAIEAATAQKVVFVPDKIINYVTCR
ncbi:leucyl-tRNA synthetase [Yoonia maricola]|uniref:Leucine--tRNA ligase n=1 Tax=Yoonia maricola TaxID=420999 RepID=A0A2M8WPR0_9RHOB|nr:leucine--tRNA ligase [Yoonia maricola]PJI92920.1 leucyl-tRNA synthetase [Yoonia maricola]